MTVLRTVALTAIPLALVACSGSSSTATLYRNSSFGAGVRVHLSLIHI